MAKLYFRSPSLPGFHRAPTSLRAWLLALALAAALPAMAQTGADEDDAIVDEEDLISTLLEDDALAGDDADLFADPAADDAADPFADVLDDVPEAVEEDLFKGGKDADDPFDAVADDDPVAAEDDIFAGDDVMDDLPEATDAGAAAEAAAAEAAAAEAAAAEAAAAEAAAAEAAAAEAAAAEAAAAEAAAAEAAAAEAAAAEAAAAEAAAAEAAAAEAAAAEAAAAEAAAAEAAAAEAAAEDVVEDDIFDLPEVAETDGDATTDPVFDPLDPDREFRKSDKRLDQIEARLAARAEDEQDAGDELVEPVLDPVELATEPIIADVPTTGDAGTEPVGDAAMTEVVETVVEAPDPIAEELRDIIRQSRLKRQARKLEAMSTLEFGDEALAAREWIDAAELYKKAFELLDALPDRQAYVDQRRHARQGEAEAMYRLAIAHFKIERLEKARNMTRTVMSLDPEHPGAQKLLLRIDAFEERKAQQDEAEADRRKRDLQDRARQPEYRETVLDIKALMKRGRQHYFLGEYEEAQREFESILSLDPYHVDALALREKVARRRYDLRSMEMQGTQQDMMRDVRRAWRPADYVPRVPQRIAERENRGGVVEVTDEQSVVDKMKQIIIPELDFRQAKIYDVIAFLHDASRQYAPDTWTDQEKNKGITIILDLGDKGGGASAPVAQPDEPLDPFADPGAFGGGDLSAEAVDASDTITFNARFITLFDALKVITEIQDLKYRVEGDIILVVPKDAPDGDILVRYYPVNPNFMDRTREVSEATSARSNRRGSGGGEFISFDEGVGVGAEPDLEEMFKGLGMEFPSGASIGYISALSKLVVANTSKNLQRFEEILRELDVIPKQIEIEARFVDIGQIDMSELGLEYLLTDDYELANKGNGAAGAQQRISIAANANNGGFTRGVRFLDEASGVAAAVGGGAGTLGSLLQIQSFLTNPELGFILHALEQSGNANLLSAPKVLTQAGEEASIKVVKEFIYPTEYDTEVIQSQVPGGGTIPVGSTVTPTSFETREVGVILTVLPEVSPEGHLITLTMTPQVVSGPEFVDYGSSTTLPDGTVNTTSYQQPIFFTREVTTRVIIYDGSTVVMGGMITEDLQTTDDKVPLLGDLPLLGRLFRSKTSISEKRNLLIFVTARLVDPSGKPIGTSQPLLTRTLGGVE